MANKFEKKEWEDRQSQHPSRRKLLPTGQESIYDVERAEGDVTVPGDAFDALNMNDLEKRVYDAFGKLDATDISVLDKANVFTKTNVEEVLLELFTSASNGKKAFADAIGGSASSTFQVLANMADSIKKDRDSGKQLVANAIGETRNGTASASESFSQLAKRITNDKKSFCVKTANFEGLYVQEKGSYNKVHISTDFGFAPSSVLVEKISILVSKQEKHQSYTAVAQVWSYPSVFSMASPQPIDDIPSVGEIKIENITRYGFDIVLSMFHFTSTITTAALIRCMGDSALRVWGFS